MGTLHHLPSRDSADWYLAKRTEPALLLSCLQIHRTSIDKIRKHLPVVRIRRTEGDLEPRKTLPAVSATRCTQHREASIVYHCSSSPLLFPPAQDSGFRDPAAPRNSSSPPSCPIAAVQLRWIWLTPIAVPLPPSYQSPDDPRRANRSRSPGCPQRDSLSSPYRSKPDSRFATTSVAPGSGLSPPTG